MAAEGSGRVMFFSRHWANQVMVVWPLTEQEVILKKPSVLELSVEAISRPLASTQCQCATYCSSVSRKEILHLLGYIDSKNITNRAPIPSSFSKP